MRRLYRHYVEGETGVPLRAQIRYNLLFVSWAKLTGV